MINKSTLLFVFFAFFQIISNAQNTSLLNEKTKISVPILEKVYLHTDRSYYNLGESLWYKAYLTSANNNKLIDQSNLLYVELISPDSKIAARNITHLKNGLGNGDIILSDSIGIKPGTYQLRAYTNFMRNFEDDFIFKKKIEIIDINEHKTNTTTKAVIYSKSKSIEINNNITEKAPINIQFFPEGGSLIENVPTLIAFKATDKNGNSIGVTGTIKDTRGKMVSMFKSQHDGMGKFILKPTENEQYIAEVTDLNNEIANIKLPKAEKSGYSLSVNSIQHKRIAIIKTNQNTLNKAPDTPFKIIIKTKGITYFEGIVNSKKTSTPFLIPTEVLPAGIAQITIYDNEGKPHSERLIYVNKDNNINITLSTNKRVYKTKEKVDLKVVAKNKEGVPVSSSFSVAATDAGTFDSSTDYGTNICSYFLMESDIKGKVNDPEYYFNESNVNRIQHLDLLLLTQGWRDFLWKKDIATNNNLKFKAEKGFHLSGRVKKLFGSAAKVGNDVNLYFVNNEKSYIKFDKTDNSGFFKFNNLQLFGKTNLRVSVKDQKNKRKGMIVLDTTANKPLFTDYRVEKIISSINNKRKIIKENIFKKHVEFNVPMDNRLDEILIIGKKASDKTNDLGFADQSYVTTKEDANYTNIVDLIQFSVPGVVVNRDTISFSRNNGMPALIMVDEVEIDMSFLNSISPSNVAKIEALNSANAAGFGPNGVNGVILIYTKDGKGVSNEKRKFHTVTKIIDGYYSARIFYSPDHTKEPEWDATSDIRNTLYWNPYVHPDVNGNTTVSYFNTEVSTKVNVTLEGITAEGVPLVVKTNYLIEK